MLPPKGKAENELEGLYRKSHFKGERCGYAAGCEAWLCPAVDTRFEKGLHPRFGPGPMFTGRSPNQGRSPKFFWVRLRRGKAPPHIRRRSRNIRAYIRPSRSIRAYIGEAAVVALTAGEAVVIEPAKLTLHAKLERASVE